MPAGTEQSISNRVRAHIRSNIYGLIAIFIALGGTAIAATQIAKNSVGSRAIKNGAVKNKKLADNAVTGLKVADGSLTGSDIDLATLGAVPGAAHAATATEAEHATTADEAANALQLGGFSPAEFQRRVTGTCSAGNAIRTIDASGGVTCEPSGAGTITGVGVSGGLTGGGTTGNVNVGVDSAVLQSRVNGTCAAGTAITSVAQNGTVGCSSAFAPAGQVLSSGQVNTGVLLQHGGISVSTACEAFAGEADVSISVNSGTLTFTGDTGGGPHVGATGFPAGVGAVLGRTSVNNPAQVTFSALTSAGKTLNGNVLMIRNGPGSCTYEASAITGG